MRGRREDDRVRQAPLSRRAESVEGVGGEVGRPGVEMGSADLLLEVTPSPGREYVRDSDLDR